MARHRRDEKRGCYLSADRRDVRSDRKVYCLEVSSNGSFEETGGKERAARFRGAEGDYSRWSSFSQGQDAGRFRAEGDDPAPLQVGLSHRGSTLPRQADAGQTWRHRGRGVGLSGSRALFPPASVHRSPVVNSFVKKQRLPIARGNIFAMGKAQNYMSI